MKNNKLSCGSDLCLTFGAAVCKLSRENQSARAHATKKIKKKPKKENQRARTHTTNTQMKLVQENERLAKELESLKGQIDSKIHGKGVLLWEMV